MAGWHRIIHGNVLSPFQATPLYNGMSGGFISNYCMNWIGCWSFSSVKAHEDDFVAAHHKGISAQDANHADQVRNGNVLKIQRYPFVIENLGQFPVGKFLLSKADDKSLLGWINLFAFCGNPGESGS